MTTTPYDPIADWYDRHMRAAWATQWFEQLRTVLMALMGDIRDKDICDLACGQGTVSRWLAKTGAANVVAVDISRRLLAMAEREEQASPLGITYLERDAQRLTLAENSFDGVLCTFALADIEKVEACIAGVHSVLRPNGWFVFVITHPCFEAPGSEWLGPDRLVRNYFQEGFWRSDNPNGVRGKAGAYHRTLGTYINVVAEAGFVVERVIEPQGPAGMSPDTNQVPAFLAVRCTKA